MKRLILVITLLSSLLAGAACLDLPAATVQSSALDASASHVEHRVGSFPILTWGGDLSTSSTMQDQYINVPRDAGQTGALEWDGSSWYLGAAGGTVSPGDAGTFFVSNDAGTATEWVSISGDLGCSASNPGACTVNDLQGKTVTIGTPSTGNTLGWNGSAFTPAALNLAGGSNYVTGVLPLANITVGTAGQILVTNSGATAPAWASCSQDIACSTLTVGQMALQSITPTGGTSTIVPFNAGGLKLSTSPWVLQDSGAVQRFSLETAHGRGTFGGGGSDSLATLGPLVGAETSEPALWFLPYGTAPTTTNSSFYGVSTGGLVINNATINFDSGNNPWASFTLSGSAVALQSYTSQTSLGVGTNKAGALTKLYGDANVQNMTLGNAAITTTAYNEFDAVSPPGAGAANTQRFYVDSGDGKLKVIDSAGNIFTLTP